MHVKIHGGTARSGEHLCLSCASAMVVRNTEGKVLVQCTWLDRRIYTKIESCTKYRDGTQPSLDAMKDSAWVLRTDKYSRQIGFVPMKELRRKGEEPMRDDGPDEY